MTTIIISAMTKKNRVIGKDNWLPWDIKEELQMFRRLTQNSTVIMGRKTYESIGRPMPKRRNIVVSRSMEHKDGIEVARSVEEALQNSQDEKIFIIGGAQIYKHALENKLADKMYLSFIKKEYDGDTKFPEFDESQWEIQKEEDHEEFEFVILRKK